MPGYISEYDHYGNTPDEFIEIAIPKGTDVSSYTIVIYDSSGFVKATFSLGPLQSTMGGYDVYVIDGSTPGIVNINPGEATALVDDTGTVLQFISHDTTLLAQDGPAAGQTSTLIGTVTGTNSSLQSDDGGLTYYTQNAPNPGVVPCYAPGTLIDTPDSARKVETLRSSGLNQTIRTLVRGSCELFA